MVAEFGDHSAVRAEARVGRSVRIVTSQANVLVTTLRVAGNQDVAIWLRQHQIAHVVAGRTEEVGTHFAAVTERRIGRDDGSPAEGFRFVRTVLVGRGRQDRVYAWTIHVDVCRCRWIASDNLAHRAVAIGITAVAPGDEPLADRVIARIA